MNHEPSGGVIHEDVDECHSHGSTEVSQTCVVEEKANTPRMNTGLGPSNTEGQNVSSRSYGRYGSLFAYSRKDESPEETARGHQGGKVLSAASASLMRRFKGVTMRPRPRSQLLEPRPTTVAEKKPCSDPNHERSTSRDCGEGEVIGFPPGRKEQACDGATSCAASQSKIDAASQLFDDDDTYDDTLQGRQEDQAEDKECTETLQSTWAATLTAFTPACTKWIGRGGFGDVADSASRPQEWTNKVAVAPLIAAPQDRIESSLG